MRSALSLVLFVAAALGQQPSGSGTAVKTQSVHKKTATTKAKADFSDTITLHREIPLPASARAALDLSESLQVSGTPTTVDKSGRVIYQYGHGVPTVVCSTLQVCEIDLEPGESISKDAVDWGDHRYEVSERTAGSGQSQFPYLVIKPTLPGLNTSMSVGTTKRSYYIQMLSVDDGRHMSRVAFAYPEEEAQKKEEEAKKKEAAQAAALAMVQHEKDAAVKLSELRVDRPIRNWNFTVKLHGRDAKYLKPYSIADDGVKTHIILPEEAHHRGLPVIQITDARGDIPANDHWEKTPYGADELVVDAVFEHGCLLEGVGRKQQRACITNEGLGR